jgi:hypothetical protein
VDGGAGAVADTSGTADAGAAPQGGNFDALGSEYDALLAQDGETIPVKREQLQKYAQEHKNYRQKWGETARTFDGLHQEDVKAMANFLRQASDPSTRGQAVQWMRSVLEEMSPAEKAQAIEDLADAEDARGGDGDKLAKQLDPDTVKSMIQEELKADREKAAADAQQAQFIQQVNTTMKELAGQFGVEELGDPNSPIYRVVLSTAYDIKGDKIEALKTATESVMNTIDKAGQKLMSKKTAGAAGPAVAQKGQEPGGRKQPTTLEDAKRSAMDRLGARVG